MPRMTIIKRKKNIRPGDTVVFKDGQRFVCKYNDMYANPGEPVDLHGICVYHPQYPWDYNIECTYDWVDTQLIDHAERDMP